MQVKILYVKFKNLMSFGNVETHVVLDKHQHTLITGSNGCGKSSVIESIFYGLYGKPYRSVKVGQLVNSTNKKALLVEIGIESNGNQYKVIRGQKPSIFQIYENDVLIQEDAATKDYQQLLETKILGINQRSFRQIVCIGSASYKPFMDLTAAERRAITEEVLDIAVFSTMSDLAKRMVAELRSSVDSLSTEITMLKNQIQTNKSLLESLEEERERRAQIDTFKRNELETLLKQYQEEIDLNTATLEALDADNVTEKLTKCRQLILAANSKLSTEKFKLSQVEHKLTHFDTLTVCSSCGQDLPKVRSAGYRLEIEKLVTDTQHVVHTIEASLAVFEAKEKQLTEQDAVCNEVRAKLSNAEFGLKTAKKQLSELTVEDNSSTIKQCKQTLATLAQSIIEKTNEKTEHSKNLLYYKTAIELLKDDGIKSRIIATFIPIMNEYINEYLKKFDMFVKFELDEYFNEKILSRNRDSFTYNSFSQGEKQKIDIAILMAWRKVAMIRSSVACNLLIFDETMDSSLDNESIDIFIDVLSSVEDTVNTLVISHRSTIVPEIFDRHLTLSKVRDFSVIKES